MVVALDARRQVRVQTPYVSGSEDRTRGWGRLLGAALPRGTVVGLVGELGAGKTVLASAVLRGAGLDPSVRVTSPTFTIMNHYPGDRPYVHVDLYRLADAAEAFEAGVAEALTHPGDGVVVVEWFERFSSLWPDSYLRVDIAIEDARGRLLAASGPPGVQP